MRITISQADTECTPSNTAICANRELVAAVKRGESVTFEVDADYVEIDAFCGTAHDMDKALKDTHFALLWESDKKRLRLVPEDE